MCVTCACDDYRIILCFGFFFVLGNGLRVFGSYFVFIFCRSFIEVLRLAVYLFNVFGFFVGFGELNLSFLFFEFF